MSDEKDFLSLDIHFRRTGSRRPAGRRVNAVNHKNTAGKKTAAVFTHLRYVKFILISLTLFTLRWFFMYCLVKHERSSTSSFCCSSPELYICSPACDPPCYEYKSIWGRMENRNWLRSSSLEHHQKKQCLCRGMLAMMDKVLKTFS